jgi:hypothetical protein
VLGVPLFVGFDVPAGALLGWLRLASGSVVPPTVARAALNAVAGLPLLLLRGVDPAVAGGLYSPVGWLVLLAAVGLLVVTGKLRRVLVGGPAGRSRPGDRPLTGDTPAAQPVG